MSPRLRLLALALALASCREGNRDTKHSEGAASAGAPTAPAAASQSSAASAPIPAPTASEAVLDPLVSERLKKMGRTEPKEVERFLVALQAITRAGDRAAACALVEYPLRASPPQKAVRDAAACEKNYEKLFTPAVVAAIEKQQFSGLFVNTDGVMIGTGEVWFTARCTDKDCEGPPLLRIIAINS